MLNALLKRFNQHRKEKYFQNPLFSAQKEYAFIGFGIHSMTSLYPILRHFNIRLKYICTKESDWQKQLGPLFPGCVFTHDLDTVATDPAVAGVFVCAAPRSHDQILTRLLKAGKPVLVEKPPCETLSQLRELSRIAPAGVCKLGLQRRHWPGNKSLSRPCRIASDYLYRFQTGPYPQGDPFTELFIHPLDYSSFLFGPPKLKSCSKHEDRRGITLQLHLMHSGGISGLLHLTTHYTWNPPLERLTVNTPGAAIDVRYPTAVTGRQMPVRVMNAPAERLTGQQMAERQYFSGAPTLVPALETNPLFTQGFLREVEDFVTRVENASAAAGDANDLGSLVPVYELIEEIKGMP